MRNAYAFFQGRWKPAEKRGNLNELIEEDFPAAKEEATATAIDSSRLTFSGSCRSNWVNPTWRLIPMATTLDFPTQFSGQHCSVRLRIRALPFPTYSVNIYNTVNGTRPDSPQWMALWQELSVGINDRIMIMKY